MWSFAGKKKVFGLDINDKFLRAAFLKEGSGGCKLVSFNQVKLAPETVKGGEIVNSRRLKTALQRLVKEALPERIKTRYVVVALPDSKVFVHVFRLPANLSEEEIKKSVPFEAENLIPFSVNEVYWDYQIIGKDGDKSENVGKAGGHKMDSKTGKPAAVVADQKYIEVLYAAVPRTVADAYYKVLRSVRIYPVAFTLASDSTAQALIHAIQTKFGSLIVNLGEKVSNLTIFDHDAIESNVSIFETGQTFLKEVAAKLHISEEQAKDLLSQKVITDQEAINVLLPLYQKIAKEIKNLLDFYDKEKEHHGRIRQIVLYGRSSSMPGLLDFLAKQFEMPVLRADPWDNIKISGELKKMMAESINLKKHRLLLFASSVGAGLRAITHRPFEGGINLLPSEIKEILRKARMILEMKILAFLLIWFCLAILVGFGYVGGRMFFELKTVEKQAGTVYQLTQGTRYQEIRNFVDRFNQEVAVLNKIQFDLYDVAEVGDLIKAQIPEQITVTSFDFAVGGSQVALTGIAPVREDLLSLEERFRNLEIVDTVSFPLSNLDKPENLSFSLQLTLAKNKLPYF